MSFDRHIHHFAITQIYRLLFKPFIQNSSPLPTMTEKFVPTSYVFVSCKKGTHPQNTQIQSIIFFEKPIVVTEKEILLELVVSPPDSFKLYFFCSFL